MTQFRQLGGWPRVLGRLAAGEDLSAEEAGAALAEVLHGRASASQIAAFIFGLRCKGETVEEMTGLLQAMLAVAQPVPVPAGVGPRLVDTCGTGGDRRGTINVSTIAALVVAGAGVPVCKHGNRAQSSQTGSADVLEALGVVIDLGPEAVARCIEEAGIGFCLAPRFHPALRHAGPTRKEIGVPTALNFLGPLANPARAGRQLVGVGDPAMAATMLGVLARNGAQHVWVVYGADGLDELTTTSTSTVLEWHAQRDGSREPLGEAAVSFSRTIKPEELGLVPARLDDLRGGDAAANATVVRRVLNAERGAHRDIVVLNAAAGLVVGGAVPDLAEGIAVASAAIDDGRAASCLDRLIKVSQAAAAS